MKKMIEQIKHIIKGWYYRLRGINLELMEQRMDQCKKCNKIIYLTKNVSICSVCWCENKAKCSVEDERCPNGLW